MKFVIGSTNQAKVQATKEVLAIHFPEAAVTSIETNSGVSNQPFSDEETRFGAINRALRASGLQENAIGIGLEGGVRILEEKLYVCNWGALVLPSGERFIAGGAQIPLPEEVAKEIRSGKELGPVIDSYFSAKGLRQKEGAMGMFTAGAVTRVDLFTHILHLLTGQLKYSLKED